MRRSTTSFLTVAATLASLASLAFPAAAQVAMAAVVRHWSTVLNGTQVDRASFKHDTDAVLSSAAEKAKARSQ